MLKAALEQLKTQEAQKLNNRSSTNYSRSSEASTEALFEYSEMKSKLTAQADGDERSGSKRQRSENDPQRLTRLAQKIYKETNNVLESNGFECRVQLSDVNASYDASGNIFINVQCLLCKPKKTIKLISTKYSATVFNFQRHISRCHMKSGNEKKEVKVRLRKRVRKNTESIESAIAQVFLHANIPFEFADSVHWRKMVKLLNSSFAAKMPKARDLERKYGSGNCLVCKSSFNSMPKSLRSTIGSKNIRFHEVLESWTGEDFSKKEHDNSMVCFKCFSNVEKCQEIQSEFIGAFNYTKHLEPVVFKQEPDDQVIVSRTEARISTASEEIPSMSELEDDPKFECDQCGLKFHERSSLIKHITTHFVDKKNISCKVCSKKFKSETSLEFHKITDHEKQTSSFECPVCFKNGLWKNLSDFRRHFLHHKEDRTLCTRCGTSLLKSSLKNHLKMHDDIRPFDCEFPDCSKKFRTLVNRKIHHRSHTGEKIFECPHCDKRFSQNVGRDLHLRNHHIHEKSNVSCIICGISLSSQALLKRHLVRKHAVVNNPDV